MEDRSTVSHLLLPPSANLTTSGWLDPGRARALKMLQCNVVVIVIIIMIVIKVYHHSHHDDYPHHAYFDYPYHASSSEKTSLPEFFCSASLCEASKKITGNGFFPTFVTQLDSKFWPGFASQKSRSSFCFTSFDFRFLSKFLISFA